MLLDPQQTTRLQFAGPDPGLALPRVLCAGGCTPVSYRLAVTALPMLLKHFGNGPQCFVHLFGGSKVACHIRLKDDDVRTRCVFRGVLAPDTFAEVVFWTQRILF